MTDKEKASAEDENPEQEKDAKEEEKEGKRYTGGAIPKRRSAKKDDD